MKKVSHKILKNVTVDELENILANLEKDGWELVHVSENHHHHGHVTVYLKKNKSWFS